ncbi:hypothetical protein PL81_04870, partial [Streptomyces sp. RSD-27]
IPDFDPHGALAGAGAPAGPALDAATRRALDGFWPGRGPELDRIAALLEERPDAETAFSEFAALVRELVGVGPAGPPAVAPPGVPDVFSLDAVAVCRALTA